MNMNKQQTVTALYNHDRRSAGT